MYYIRAASNKKWGWYLLVLGLFACALLSKPVAVVFPFTLLLIDYFEQRNINFVWPAEKTPHFILAFVFGIISIYNQRQFHALFVKGIDYNFIQRIALGCYSFITYLWKSRAPVKILSCFYPYPPKVNGALPAIYYLYIIPVAVIVFLSLKFLKKYRFAVFGLLFFVVNIALLLQFIQVGGAVFAERYSYVAYIGLFFIAGCCGIILL